MNYKDALKYLESLTPTEFNLKLDSITAACELFDNPRFAFPAVHIAGTNGKGSTATFLNSILIHSGHKVGLYTSPHLVDVRERIQINSVPISEADFTRLTKDVLGKLPNDKFLTYFEFITLIAFIYFREKKVDIAVIETGLGGRLDATNVIEPLVSIITPISFDHRAHLGSTLAEIANEKCGIIKRGVPTVVANQTPEVMNVIRKWCDEMGSPLCAASPDEILSPLGLLGGHQKQNAACAVEAANLLSSSKFKIDNIKEALLAARWPGRIEVVKESPRVILDGAHNLAGAAVLADYISKEIKKDKAILMLGIMADKDVGGICRSLAPFVREIVCVKTPSKRGASPKDIAATARSFGVVVHCEDDVKKALTKWIKKINKEDTLIVSGSLATVGEAKKYFLKK